MSDEVEEESEGELDLGGLILLLLLASPLLFPFLQGIWSRATDLPLQVLANTIFILVTLLAWGGIHYILRDKEIDLNPSRILVSELLPAATFAFAVVYYTYPAIFEFVFSTPPEYIEKGVFWSVMQVIGAIMITASTVGWVSLVSE